MGFVLQLGRATARWCGTLPGSMKAYARMDADTQTVQRVEAGVPEVGDEQVRPVSLRDRYRGCGCRRRAGLTVPGKSSVESLHSPALQVGETLFVAGASGAIGTLDGGRVVTVSGRPQPEGSSRGSSSLGRFGVSACEDRPGRRCGRRSCAWSCRGRGRRAWGRRSWRFGRCGVRWGGGG